MIELIAQTVDDFRTVVPDAARSAPVSSWSVGEHIHHCCLSMIGISKSLRKSTPPAPRPAPSLPRSVVLLLGFIPRGRSKSPSFVVPKPAVPQTELLAMLDHSKTLLEMAGTLDRGTWFTHPLLGVMRRDEALKFVLVHNRHHLRIVKDILRMRRS